MDLNKILQGDSLEVLKTLPSESINCCVTSPPYWALRKYFQGVKFKDNISKEKQSIILKELLEKGVKPIDI